MGTGIATQTMTHFFTRILLVGAALSSAAAAQRPGALTSLDSIVLERTACLGTCAASRLALLRSGLVTFTSRNRGDSARVARDSIRGLRAGDSRARDLCPALATDHPTVTTSLFGPEGMHKVVDYHGCFLQNDHSTARVSVVFAPLKPRLTASPARNVGFGQIDFDERPPNER